MYEAEQFPTMSEREKYLFDLQGFIVVKGLALDRRGETPERSCRCEHRQT